MSQVTLVENPQHPCIGWDHVAWLPAKKHNSRRESKTFSETKHWLLAIDSQVLWLAGSLDFGIGIPRYWFQKIWVWSLKCSTLFRGGSMRGMRPLSENRSMNQSKELEDNGSKCCWRRFRSPFLLPHISWCRVVSYGISWSWRKVFEAFEYRISRSSLSKSLPTHLLKQSCFIWYMPHPTALFFGTCPWSIGLAKMKRARFTFWKGSIIQTPIMWISLTTYGV